MFRTALLDRLKREKTSHGQRFLHRSYMRTKQNSGLLPREKQARQLSTCLNKPLTAQRCSSQIDWTIEPLNQNSQTAHQEYGLLPANVWQQLLAMNKNR